mgnify:CR=1 FL=1|tara:strand:- start:71 stop:634 length:564 start_codon:yes stop_codon:yes gene_type:complete
MPRLIELLLKESYRGRDNEKVKEMLAELPTTSSSYRPSRRGRPSIDQSDLKSKANNQSSVLLKELGITSINPNPVPEVAIKETIEALISGKKQDEFELLFRNNVKIIRHKDKKTMAIWVGLTEVSQNLISKHSAIRKEYAYWFFCTILAANNSYGILNQINPSNQLKVYNDNSSYIIYLSSKGWDTL